MIEKCRYETCRTKFNGYNLGSCIALHTPFVLYGGCDVYDVLQKREKNKCLTLIQSIDECLSCLQGITS